MPTSINKFHVIEIITVREVTRAFILIITETGSTSDVVNNLTALDEVRGLYLVDGIYDIVVEVEVGGGESLRDLVSNRIRKIPGVKSTVTVVVREKT